MTTATGIVTFADAHVAPGRRQVVVDLDSGGAEFLRNQPVTLVDRHPSMIADGEGIKKDPLVAAQLNATHVGKRIRVRTTSGVVVEDVLESLSATVHGVGKTLTLAFKNVRPMNVGPWPVFDVYLTAPVTAPVTIIEEPTK